MKFSGLVHELQEYLLGEKEINWKRRDDLTQKRGIFPEHSHFVEEPVKLDGGLDKESYRLTVSYFGPRSLRDTQSVLDEIRKRICDQGFEKGVAKAEYDIYWTPDDFQQETKLPNFLSTVKLKQYANVVNTNKLVGQHQWSSKHSLEAELTGSVLSLGAEGAYRANLKQLVEQIQPQRAVLSFSKEDAERVIRKGGELNRILGKYLEKKLKPKKGNFVVLPKAGVNFGPMLQEREFIEVTISRRDLNAYYELVAKPLVNGGDFDETRVQRFVKNYNPLALIRGDRLRDLQTIASEVSFMDLGFQFDTPIVTKPEARIMLDKTIGLLENSYKPRFSNRVPGSRVLKSLVSSYFGENFLQPVGVRLQNLGVYGFGGEADNMVFFEFLKSKGYRSNTPCLENVYPNDMRERHLFEFFKQAYSDRPEEVTASFRDCYRNVRHETEITAEVKRDASSKIVFPKRSSLYGVDLENIRGRDDGVYNDLGISRISPRHDEVHFFSRVSFDDPILLSLQDYACENMGVGFSLLRPSFAK